MEGRCLRKRLTGVRRWFERKCVAFITVTATLGSCISGVDVSAVKDLIESSFGGRLNHDYFDELKAMNPPPTIYIAEGKTGLAVITRTGEVNGESVPYLDKFAVAPEHQSIGAGKLLWQAIRKDCPKLMWRSRRDNMINSWYFEQADGCESRPPWNVFWCGLKASEVGGWVDWAAQKPSTLRRPGVSITGTEGSFPIETPRAAASSSSSSAASSSSSSPTSSSAASENLVGGDGTSSSTTRIGLIGACGYVGAELIRLLSRRPHARLTVASSRALAGKPVSLFARGAFPGGEGAVIDPATIDPSAAASFGNLAFEDLQPEQLAKREVDVWVLALPNKLAPPLVASLSKGGSKAKFLDLSADYRFDADWQYGLPEREGFRPRIASSSRVSNPGCYATGMQFSLLPLEGLLDPTVPPVVFGVSGYSGAGTTPSRKNDLGALENNLMAYTLVDHLHEREVSSQLKGVSPAGVRFTPHVASFFRGIHLTVAVTLLTTCLDNLLKGAATQALQNIHLMQGLPELTAIHE